MTKIVEDPSDLRLVYEPDNPDANADGYVEYPNVDTVTEMTNLIDSSRSYEASATAFNAAKISRQKDWNYLIANWYQEIDKWQLHQ